jgi:hypothetical protein
MSVNGVSQKWLKTKRETDKKVEVRCRSGDAEITAHVQLKAVVDAVVKPRSPCPCHFEFDALLTTEKNST